MTIEDIKALISLFDQSGLSKLELKAEHDSLLLEKATLAPATLHMFQPAPAPTAPSAPAPSLPAPAPQSGEPVTSPMVGTFYRCPSPNAAPYVKIGDTVRKGQTLGIIEAMKILNELEAEFDCKILDVVPEDGQPVEYGATLFLVERL